MVDLNEDRKLAARVAASANLVDVRLFNVEAALEWPPDDLGGLGYTFNASVEVQYVEDTAVLIVDGDYTLDVTHGAVNDDGGEDADGAEAATVATLKFKQAALFTMTTPDPELGPFSDEELNAFGKTTGQLALHPYAREFVFGITGRMGLPPLHIGMMKIPVDKEFDAGAGRKLENKSPKAIE